jgi:uncharacterized iron-regulated protein
LLLQMLPGVPWVDSSPSNGIIALQQQEHNNKPSTTKAAAAAAQPAASPAAATAAPTEQQVHQVQVIKRWGNPQNPKYGDVHFYDYRNDCQVSAGTPAAGAA